MTARILCPTDGSDHATTGLRLAAEIARQTGTPLTICVVNIAHGGARGPVINHWTTEQASALLDTAVATAAEVGAPDVSRVELLARDAATAILTYAEREAISHIVMGTGDKHGVRRLVLGSVSAAVAGQAHCTVTIARH